MPVYEIYKTKIAFPIGIPEFKASSAEAEVRINPGRIPQDLVQPTFKRLCVQSAPGRFLQKIPGEPGILVFGGNRITIDESGTIDSADLLSLLSDTVWGGLFQQRGYPTLHGCALVIGEKTHLFLGRAASGKSLLAAVAAIRGLKVAAENLCVLAGKNSGKSMSWQLLPGWPHLLLWQDTIRSLKWPFRKGIPVKPDLNKFRVPLDNKYCLRPPPLATINELCYHWENIFKFEPVTGMEKLSILGQHSFPPHAISEDLLGIAKSLPFNRIIRPYAKEPVHAFPDEFWRFFMD